MTDELAKRMTEWLELHKDADVIMFRNDGLPHYAYYKPAKYMFDKDSDVDQSVGHEPIPKGSFGS